ncbi:MAG: YajD family HNH nuclease [Magnetococcus sp. WYHC-3]
MQAIVAQAHASRAEREKGYRAQALKLYPWVCGRCSREFTNVNLSELTVHHRDHNHDNNPADGSNWELLCLYCHDHEHEKLTDHQRRGGGAVARDDEPAAATHNPFADLKKRLGMS